MKKRKIIIGTALLCCLIMGAKKVHATSETDVFDEMTKKYGELDTSEDLSIGNSIEEMVREENIQSSNSNHPSDRMNSTLLSVESKLLNGLSADLNADPDNISYLTFLNEIREGFKQLPNEIKNDDYIMEYILIYTARIRPNNTLEYVTARKNLIHKTFEDIKKENTSALLEASKQGEQAKLARFGKEKPVFNLMLNYSNLYALSPNLGFRIFSEGDCTNFASQILWKGGMSERYHANASGSNWYYSGWFDSSLSWRLARSFVQYWTADGASITGFTPNNTSGIQANAKAGDFLAYLSKKTGQIEHIAFIDWKSNGQLYVSQHSDNRRHDNWMKKVVKTDGINPYSKVYVMKFF